MLELDPVRRRTLIWLAASLLCGAVPGIGVAAAGARPTWHVILASATIAVCVAPVARRIVHRRFDIFEPIVFATAMLLVLFGIRSLWVTASGEHQWTPASIDVGPWLGGALLGGLLGCLAFVLGYELAAAALAKRRKVSAPAAPPAVRAVTPVAVVMGLLGAGLWIVSLGFAGSVSRGLELALSGRSSVSQAALSSSEYLTSAPILSACGGLLVLLAARGRVSRRQFALIVALVSISCLIFGLGGGRRFILPSVGIPLVAFALMRNWRPGPRLLAACLPVVFLLLALIPLVRNEGARANAGGFIPAVAHNVTHPDEVVRSFFDGPDTENVVIFAMEISVLRNWSDYAHGSATVGDLLLAPIPHKIFPDKPVTARDRLLLKMIGSECDPSGAGCPDASALGSFYQDFGVPSLIIGMALLGLGSAALWNAWLRNPGRAGTVLLAASWSVMLPVLLRAGWMPGFAWWLYFVVPTAAALWFVSSNRTHLVRTTRGIAARRPVWQRRRQRDEGGGDSI